MPAAYLDPAAKINVSVIRVQVPPNNVSGLVACSEKYKLPIGCAASIISAFNALANSVIVILSCKSIPATVVDFSTLFWFKTYP